jgi:hypothetical protein
MTGVEIAAAIQAGKAAFDTIRGMAEVVGKSESATEAVQIATAMAELGARVTEMQAAILELSRENDELRRQLQAAGGDALEDFKKRYRYEENVCWKYDGSGNRVDGPYCPNCVDEGQERRLNPGATKGTYTCVVHKSRFMTAEYRTNQPPTTRPRGSNSWMA